MLRPTGQETTANEKIMCFSQFPRRGGTSCHRGQEGSTRVGQEAEGEGATIGKSQKGQVRQGKKAWAWLVWIISSGPGPGLSLVN